MNAYYGCIGPSSLEEEALASQGQPDQPIGPADSAGVALNEATCAARRSNQNTRCQGLAVLNGGWIVADGITKGWIWGAAAREKNGSTTSQDKTVTTRLPALLLGNIDIGRRKFFKTSRLMLCA